MDLTDLLLAVRGPETPLIIIEPAHPDPRTYERQRFAIEQELTDILDRDVTLIHTTTEDAHTAPLRDGIVLLNATHPERTMLHAVETLRALPTYTLLRDSAPEAYAVFVAHSETRHVLWHIIHKLTREDQPEHTLGLDGHPTVLAYLGAHLGRLRHDLGSAQDVTFKAMLSKQCAEGNHQAQIDKTFLMIRDGNNDTTGKFLITPRERWQEHDLRDLLGIFIDNADTSDRTTPTVGAGIDVLPALLDTLAAAHLDIPVFYETAHPITAFSAEDRARIALAPHVHLIPKHSAPKISLNRRGAENELLMSRLLAQDAALRPYIIETIPVGPDGFLESHGRYITLSAAARTRVLHDPEKERVLTIATVEDNPLTHKLYVLSRTHTVMRAHLAEMQPATNAFLPGERITASVTLHDATLGDRVRDLIPTYERIARTHEALSPRTVGHNDAKWDNWFSDTVLGDFGSAAPGREYKDIAKVLLDPTSAFTTTQELARTDAAIDAYLRMRRVVDPTFMEDQETFQTHVYEMLVTESMRIAHYRALLREHETVTGLLRVAEQYATLLERPPQESRRAR